MASPKCSNLVSPKKKISSKLAWPAVAPSTSSSNAWIGNDTCRGAIHGTQLVPLFQNPSYTWSVIAMGKLYEELKDMLTHEKGIAMATVVRGPEHVGAKLLV